jgi:prophage regulatory protein
MISEQKPKRILRRPEVQSRVGLTHSQIDSMEKRGLFPKRIKISVKAAGWLEHEVDEFIDQRVAQSRGESASSSDQAAA